MRPLELLAVGFAPGIFWLWMIVRANTHRPDPLSLVIRTFLLGVVVALPVVVIGHMLLGPGARVDVGRMPLAEAAFLAFVVAGFVEEFGKFLVVRLSLGDSPYFDEPLRGLIYGSAVALGFASIENVGYMLGFGPEVIAPRALTATLAHVFFSALWGYGLGLDRRTRDEGGAPRGYAFLGVTAAIAAHGGYDVLLFIGEEPLAGLTLLASGAAAIGLLARARRTSIHRGRTAAAHVRCPHCAARAPAGKPFCTGCGNPLARDLERRCGGCEAPLAGRPAFCGACGARVAGGG